MKTRVADPALRRAVEAAVRRRIRGDDAEDVVQATLADVLSNRNVPEAPEEFRRFVFGVARNKVFDHFRRQRYQTVGLQEDDVPAPEPPLSARDILRWAEGELPDSEAHGTLEWMLREGDGEKLEHIARDAKVPAARVRKRVSRLRKLLRERWAAELLSITLVLLLAGGGLLLWYSYGRDPNSVVEREPPAPLPSGRRDAAPSRPAGSTTTIPNLVKPPQVAPAPSGSSDVRRQSTGEAAPSSAKPRVPAPGKAPKAAEGSGFQRLTPLSTGDARQMIGGAK